MNDKSNYWQFLLLSSSFTVFFCQGIGELLSHATLRYNNNNNNNNNNYNNILHSNFLLLWILVPTESSKPRYSFYHSTDSQLRLKASLETIMWFTLWNLVILSLVQVQTKLKFMWFVAFSLKKNEFGPVAFVPPSWCTNFVSDSWLVSKTQKLYCCGVWQIGWSWGKVW